MLKTGDTARELDAVAGLKKESERAGAGTQSPVLFTASIAGWADGEQPVEDSGNKPVNDVWELVEFEQKGRRKEERPNVRSKKTRKRPAPTPTKPWAMNQPLAKETEGKKQERSTKKKPLPEPSKVSLGAFHWIPDFGDRSRMPRPATSSATRQSSAVSSIAFGAGETSRRVVAQGSPTLILETTMLGVSAIRNPPFCLKSPDEIPDKLFQELQMPHKKQSRKKRPASAAGSRSRNAAREQHSRPQSAGQRRPKSAVMLIDYSLPFCRSKRSQKWDYKQFDSQHDRDLIATRTALYETMKRRSANRARVSARPSTAPGSKRSSRKSSTDYPRPWRTRQSNAPKSQRSQKSMHDSPDKKQKKQQEGKSAGLYNRALASRRQTVRERRRLRIEMGKMQISGSASAAVSSPAPIVSGARGIVEVRASRNKRAFGNARGFPSR